MSSPNLYRPTNPEAEGLLLRVEVVPLDPEDRWRERLDARIDALTNGKPGFVAAGTMTDRQTHAYATRMQSGDLVRRNARVYEEHPRFISVYHDTETKSHLVGLAEYGSSGTDWAARLRYEDEMPAHMDTIGVASKVYDVSKSRYRPLNDAEQYAIGSLLLHTVAVDSMNAEASPVGTVHTLLEYNTERVDFDWIVGEVGRLGLDSQLRQDEEVTPGVRFAVPVLNEAAMDRRMLALPTAPLAEALVAQAVWIEEPRAS